jgi:hypothetical protein
MPKVGLTIPEDQDLLSKNRMDGGQIHTNGRNIQRKQRWAQNSAVILAFCSNKSTSRFDEYG